jgi:hypothetical protein
VRAVTTAIVLVALTACAARAPSPDPLGYVSVKRVEGCGTPVNTGPVRYTNVVLGQELSYKLLGLLRAKDVDSHRCWQERSDGTLELEAGPSCNPSVIAHFRQRDGEWKLEVENYHPVVLCHERIGTR